MKVRTSTCTYSSIQLFCKKSSKSSQIRPFNFAPYQINKIVLSRHEFLWYRIHVEGLVLILPGTNLTKAFITAVSNTKGLATEWLH